MPDQRNPSPAQLAARFKPGQPSANPGGRPKGIERQIRDLLKDDWHAIACAMRDIALGRLPPGITGETTVKIKDRIDAANWCYDRGWGKARGVTDVTQDILDAGAGSLDVEQLDESTLEMLEEQIRRVNRGRGIIDVAPGRERVLAPAVDPRPAAVDQKSVAPEPVPASATDPKST